MAKITSSQPTQPPPLVDNPGAPELYADVLAGLAFNNGNLNFTFATIRADYTKTPPPNVRVVTARLVMSLAAAAGLQAVLRNAIKDLEAKGLVQKATTGPVTLQ